MQTAAELCPSGSVAALAACVAHLRAILRLDANRLCSPAVVFFTAVVGSLTNHGRLVLYCAGCPANVVTGNGAGSSLLRQPSQLQDLVAAMVSAVGQQVPVSVKMRSGFTDTSLFQDNLLAVQEAGAAFVTIHPRTKQQAYSGAADWSLIALAKQLLSIPVVRRGWQSQLSA